MLGFQGYPTPDSDNQISRIGHTALWANERYPNVKIGFADHSLPGSDLILGLSATALGSGAKVFEKHLTLSQVMKYEDYESAINPDQFAVYASQLRECAKAYGKTNEDDDFGMSDSEIGYRKFVRRNVIATRPIPPGSVISEKDVTLKRSSVEGAITDKKNVVGRKAKSDISENQAFTENCLI